jgi:LAO/AO transport system kinase
MQVEEILQNLPKNSHRHIARAITIVENELSQYEYLLENIRLKNTPVIGFTGAPGAGKSTLVNQFIKRLLASNKKVAVIAVDPTSPFNFGALLGDRIRMLEHYKNENLFIRSIATRGSLGGLSDKIIEIIEIFKASNFDYVIIETVGVGQSEVEIAGLADICAVVLVPEMGDQIQNMKSGIMEIADVFVVNKADKPGTELFINNLKLMLHYKENGSETPIVATEALNDIGIDELANTIINQLQSFEKQTIDKKAMLLAIKTFKMIQKDRMKGILLKDIYKDIKTNYNKEFNLYKYIKQYK